MAGRNRAAGRANGRRAPRRFGAVRVLPSGRYQASYLHDGLRTTAPMTFETAADADAWLATVQSDLVRGTLRAPRKSRETLADYGARWIAQRPGLRASTRRQYETDFGLHIDPYLGRYPLGQVTPDLVRQWHAELGEDLREQLAAEGRDAHGNRVRKPSSRATVRDGRQTTARSYRLLRAIFGTATEDGLVPANPCRLSGAGKVEVAERPVLSPAEVERLALEVGPRYSALVHLLAWSGLRIGEAAALTRSDLDLGDRPTVRVTSRAYVMPGAIDLDAPKSKAGIRSVSLPPHIVPALQAHLSAYVPRDPGALVFTTSSGGNVLRSFGQVARRALNRIGRDDARLHDLRHTGSVLAAQSGASLPVLMQRLGHSTPAAAQVYLHATEDHGREVAEAMSRRASADAVVVPLRGVRRRAK